MGVVKGLPITIDFRLETFRTNKMKRRDKLDKLYDYELDDFDHTTTPQKMKREFDEDVVRKNRKLKQRQRKQREKRNSRWEE